MAEQGDSSGASEHGSASPIAQADSIAVLHKELRDDIAEGQRAVEKMFVQESEYSNDSSDEASTSDEEAMKHYRAERMARIFDLHRTNSTSSRGGGSTKKRAGSVASSDEANEDSFRGRSLSSSVSALPASVSADMLEKLLKIEQFLRSLPSDAALGMSGGAPSAMYADGPLLRLAKGELASDKDFSRSEAARFMPLDRGRIIKVLQCKKTVTRSQETCMKYAALIDRFGLSLMTYDDVAPVLAHRCMAILDTCTAIDGSAVFYIVCRLLPLHMDASSIIRAVLFLLERCTHDHLTIVFDLRDVDQKQLGRSDMLAFFKDHLTGGYPHRVNNILLYQPKGFFSGILLTAYRLRYLTAKLRSRTKVVKKLSSYIDHRLLDVALATAGLQSDDHPGDL